MRVEYRVDAEAGPLPRLVADLVFAKGRERAKDLPCRQLEHLGVADSFPPSRKGGMHQVGQPPKNIRARGCLRVDDDRTGNLSSRKLHSA